MGKQSDIRKFHQEGYTFSCIDMVKKDDKIWFSSREINGLFCIDIKKDESQYISAFLSENEDETYLHGQCILIEGQILFAPLYADKIALYDIAEKKFVMSEKFEETVIGEYMSVIHIHNCIYFLPFQKQNEIIIKMNLQENAIEYIDNWLNKFDLDENTNGLFREWCIVDHFLYAPVQSAYGQVMEYDLETDEIRCLQITERDHFKAICHDGDELYLVSGNALFQWNRNAESCGKKVLEMPADIEINKVIFQNECVVLFSNNLADTELPDMIIGYDVAAQEQISFVRETVKNEKQQSINSKLSHIYSVVQENDKIWVLNSTGKILYEIQTKERTVKKHFINGVDAKTIYIQKFHERKNSHMDRFVENGIVKNELELYLKERGRNENMTAQRKKIGEVIWNEIKK